jgi:YNFM family putative membrane transporter
MLASANREGGRDLRVAMVAVAGFCVFLNVYATQTLLPLFEAIFHATKGKVSMTVSATTIAIALGSPVVGLLAERFGRRQTMVASVSLLTIPILLAATSHSLSQLIAWRFVQGLLMPGIIAVTMAYISEEWAAGGAAAVMSAYVAGNVLGGVTGRFLSGVFADWLGWKMAFLLLGCLNGLGAVAVFRWLPHSHYGGHRVDLRSAWRDMTDHLRHPILLATFAAGAWTLFSLVATFTYVTFYLNAPPFHLSTAALGSIFGVYLVGVVVTPICGKWIEHFGHRRSMIASALVAAAGAALTLVHSLPIIVAGLALCSTSVFVMQAAASSYLGHVAGKARSAAAGLYSTFYYGGGTLGAMLPAAVWRIGGWNACVTLVTCSLAIVGVIVFIWWRPVAAEIVEPVAVEA